MNFKGGMGGMGNMMKQAQMMQARLQKLQSELVHKTAEGTAGGGMVKVVANGKNELVSITISKEVVLNPQIPVHTSYSVALSLTESINDSLKNKVVVLLKNKSFAQAKIPEWKNTIATTNFDRLGTIALVVDTVPPSIQPIGWKNNFTFNNQTQIVVQVKDAVSDIKKYTAILDSQWVLFSRKNDLYIYDFDEHCGLGKHQLTILAEDIAGNCNERTFFFTKEPPKANKSKKKTLVKGKKKKQSSSTKKRKKK
mgnify:CR=1 FL=1